MLLVNNLSFFRDSNLIFENLNISLGNGQITQIRGKNGSGKTTFLKVILNILIPETGDVYWEGKNINKNIFNFYNQITFISDHSTSSRKLTVIDNINFWRGLSSSNISDDDIFILLETFNLKKYIKTETMYLSAE
jgi:ABC-type transport system involved in cytochrome c biogenesis, ATPase component